MHWVQGRGKIGSTTYIFQLGEKVIELALLNKRSVREEAGILLWSVSFICSCIWEKIWPLESLNIFYIFCNFHFMNQMPIPLLHLLHQNISSLHCGVCHINQHYIKSTHDLKGSSYLYEGLPLGAPRCTIQNLSGINQNHSFSSFSVIVDYS